MERRNRTVTNDYSRLLDKVMYADGTQARIDARLQAAREHAALVEQRDRLARVLRSILDGPARVVPVGKFEVWDEARAALATIEQASPSTTGDEQGGGESSDSEQSR